MIKLNAMAGMLFFWLLLCFLAPSQAQAYSRSSDSDTGEELFQSNRRVEVLAHQACSFELATASCLPALWAGLDAWNNHPCADFTFLTGGTTSDGSFGYNPDNMDANFNLLIFVRDSWRHDRGALAMTTTTYDANTGRIVDSDVEFNEQHFAFSTDGDPLLYDLESTMAHEAGHILGLAHSAFWDATMDPQIDPGELEKRDLHSDDIEGLCAIYPPDSGCDCASSSGGSIGLCFLLGLVLLFGKWRIRGP